MSSKTAVKWCLGPLKTGVEIWTFSILVKLLFFFFFFAERFLDFKIQRFSQIQCLTMERNLISKKDVKCISLLSISIRTLQDSNISVEGLSYSNSENVSMLLSSVPY